MLFILTAYFLGSIPFGKIIGQIYGVDLQKKGSGNIGFANSLRTLGLKPAVFVLLGDVLKGFIPVVIALRFVSFEQTLAVGLTAILGHIFPVWLKFKGGKGVATGLGVIFAIDPFIGLIGVTIFIILLLLTKTVSLSSILGTWSLPVLAFFLAPQLTLLYLGLVILALFTHRENIRRLFKGTEKRITK